MSRKNRNSLKTDSKSFPNLIDIEKGLVIRPQLMLSAERKHLKMAITLFFLAKNASENGWICKQELRELAYRAGMSKGQFYRGLKDALSSDLFHLEYTKRLGDDSYRVASYGAACEILEAPVDDNAVFIPYNYLFERGIGYLAHTKAEYQNRPISQDKIRKLTGVPQATQRRLNKKFNIQRKRNIAVTQYDGSLVHGMREMGQKNVFYYNGRITKYIPSQSRVLQTSIVVAPVCKRRVRSLRKSLSVAFSCGETSRNPRLFCKTVTERDNACKSYRKSSKPVEGNFLKLRGERGKNKTFGVWDYSVVS